MPSFFWYRIPRVAGHRKPGSRSSLRLPDRDPPTTWQQPSMLVSLPHEVTIDLDPELYRAVKVEAARADRNVREIVDEAMAAWLERLEDAEDTAAAVEALAEYQRYGGVAADEFFRAHAAETRAAYDVSADG